MSGCVCVCVCACVLCVQAESTRTEEGVSNGFTLTFEFAENPYFTNKVLSGPAMYIMLICLCVSVCVRVPYGGVCMSYERMCVLCGSYCWYLILSVRTYYDINLCVCVCHTDPDQDIRAVS